MKVLIVGGVAGGATTATRLRRLDESLEIVLIEKGQYISFANCGLPYYIGDKIKEKKNLLLQTPESFKERFNIDVRVLNEVIKIDTNNKKVKILNLKDRKTYIENYDVLVLSPGAKPIKPNIEAQDEKRVYTLRNIDDTLKIKEYINKNNPKRVTIIGGGYIGLEMLENLYNLGIEVTIIEKQNHLLGPIDIDMASYIHKYILEKGIKIKLNSEVTGIKTQEDYIKIVTQNEEIDTDFVISAIGVRPENELARDCGLEVNSRGSIIVNEFMKTSDPNIYALGDVAAIKQYVTNTESFIPLAGPANKQARVVANNIIGIATRYKGTQGSSILKLFDYTIANTGINEFTAQKEKIAYDKVYLAPYSHATYYPNAEQLIIKVIYEKNTGRILGGQMIGKDGVDKRCDVLATCVRLNLTAKELSELELCYAPPYSSAKDPINIIGNMIENVLDNKVKNIYIENIDYENSIIIDVREKNEIEKGYIKNAMHIPLNEIRDYLNNHELNKGKKIIIYCQSGLRSYLACRILYGHGYKPYNLTGGYELYKNVQKY